MSAHPTVTLTLPAPPVSLTLPADVLPRWLATRGWHELTGEQYAAGWRFFGLDGEVCALPVPGRWSDEAEALGRLIVSLAEREGREPVAMAAELQALDAPAAPVVWGYASSQDAETWSAPHPTREEAIAAALADDDFDGADIWINSGKRIDPAECMVRAETILEWATDTGADREWPECAIDALDAKIAMLPTEAREELTETLASWARKWLPIVAWRVTGKPEKVRSGDE